MRPSSKLKYDPYTRKQSETTDQANLDTRKQKEREKAKQQGNLVGAGQNNAMHPEGREPKGDKGRRRYPNREHSTHDDRSQKMLLQIHQS